MKTKETITLSIDRNIAKALLMKSYEMSIKQNKRVTRSNVVEQALLKFGCKVVKEKTK